METAFNVDIVITLVN